MVRSIAEQESYHIEDITPDHRLPDTALTDLSANQFVPQKAQHPSVLRGSVSWITEVYDKAGGELLILGESGSGKTQDRAEQVQMHTIPIVFHLSS